MQLEDEDALQTGASNGKKHENIKALILSKNSF